MIIKRVISNPDQVGRDKKMSKIETSSTHENEMQDNNNNNNNAAQSPSLSNQPTDEDVMSGINSSLLSADNSDIDGDGDMSYDDADAATLPAGGDGDTHEDAPSSEDNTERYIAIANANDQEAKKSEIPRQVSVDSSAVWAQSFQRSQMDVDSSGISGAGGINANAIDPYAAYKLGGSEASLRTNDSDRIAKDWGWFDDSHYGSDGKDEGGSQRESVPDDLAASVHSVRDKKSTLLFTSTPFDMGEVVPKKGTFHLVLSFCDHLSMEPILFTYTDILS